MEMVHLFPVGMVRSICIHISVLVFSLLSYCELCSLPEMLLAFWEIFGILYVNVMDKESTLRSSEESHYINLISLK